MLLSPIALSVALGLALQAPPPAEKRPPQDPPPQLTDLTIEDLMKLEVTSAAKKLTQLFDSPSAIYVIRSEDLRRSGVRSLPEALRMVPGIVVARIDGNKWAVSSRGFSDMFSNKLLVLIDGRSVYNPTFSGVHWDIQDVMLEDVDRIEVVRGPGATVWGANAVNGVINIITRKAKETKGGLLSAGGGSSERGFGAARFGFAMGDHATARVFAKYFDRIDTKGGEDAWRLGHAGFRTDWTPNDSDTLTLQGDVVRGRAGTENTEVSLNAPYAMTVVSSSRTTSADVLTRWSRSFGEKNLLTVQFYYDRMDRQDPWFDERRDTLDFDMNDRITLLEGHDLTWGLGYRWTRGQFGNTFTAQINPDVRVDEVTSAFVQDEVDLIPDVLKFTLGAKFEYNGYTGFEFQPNIRLLCGLGEEHALWAAASRAVRTPSASDALVRFNQAVVPPPGPGLPPTLISVFGDRDFGSEEVVAYELGYRVMPAKGLSVDAAAFFNVYGNLRSLEPQPATFEATPAPPHGLVPLVMDNRIGGRAYGFELAGNWQILDGWRLQGSYAFFKMNLVPEPGSGATMSSMTDRADPVHQVYLRTSIDLAERLHLDLTGRYVSRFQAQNVPGYLEGDLRLAWQSAEGLEFSLVGQNLAQTRHFESGGAPLNIRALPVERGVYASILWRF